MRILVALGGNAILRKGEKGHPEEIWENVRKSAKLLANVVMDNEVVVTHGNGPQVGYLLEAMMSVAGKYPPQGIDAADAMTQGWLGYMIQSAIEEAVDYRKHAVTIVTRVLVRGDDPSLSSPTKPVGRYVSKEEADELSRKYGWTFREDVRGGYRRVVPSPEPVDIIETPIIEMLLREGFVVIAAGGGGIPVVRSDGRLVPVEGVVDKDLTSSLLAVRLGADRFVILTDVQGVAVNFGRPDQRWLREVPASELKRLYQEGQFPSGSMGPKVLAAIRFVEATGRPAIIGDLDRAADVISGSAGTVVIPG